jgi:FecR protein
MSDPLHGRHDPLAQLIREAGRREAPPTQAYERALAAATEVWRKKVRRRRGRVAGAIAAGAAALTVSALVLLNNVDAPSPVREPIAQVARVIGDVRVRSSGAEEWRSVHEEHSALQSGDLLRTGPASAIALHIGEMSVRVAGGAQVVFESRSLLRLEDGKVYIDTGSGGIEDQVLVVTKAGSVADIGTQFEVLYQDRRYRVRVREGRVLLQHGDQRQRGSAGDEISIGRNGAVSVASIAADGPEWQWVQSLASAPEIDDQPLAILLAWVARETGRAVRYATPAIERKVTTTILHGSIRNLEPLDALAVMLATTDLEHELMPDGTIMIR